MTLPSSPASPVAASVPGAPSAYHPDDPQGHHPAGLVRRYTPAASATGPLPSSFVPGTPHTGLHSSPHSTPPRPPVPLFLPVVDLDTGGAIAVQVVPEDPAWGAAPDAVTYAMPDPGGVTGGVAATVNGVLAAAREETALPLVLPISAAVVAAGSAGTAPLHEALRMCNRRPREVILMIEGDVAAVGRTALLSGIDGLRAVGYLVAFGELGTAPLPLDLLADAAPYVIALSADLLARGTRDPRRGALVESLVRLARGAGAHVLAPGVREETQLAAVRGWGIRLAQGPLLAPPDWRPSHGHNRVHVPLPVPEAEAAPAAPGLMGPGASGLGPRVQEFLLPAVTLPAGSTAEEVVGVLSAEPSITSVVLVDEYQRPQGSVDRSRFLLFMAGAYGHALHAKKPASRLADPAKIVAKTTPAIAAMQVAGRDTTRAYDDLVVVDEVGRCMGVVRISDLLRHVAEMQAAR
uniref:EAL domain-containing protein n=1 Tax=Microbispora cellulosiformans TaxID=2614688 RepID=UPI001CD9C1B8|nr:EAL domain-containing protein [Microbispora cellulosiformans]